MTERLEVFDLEGNLIEVKDRKDFYSEAKKEYEEKGNVSKQVKAVKILLMNSKGRIYLQKRSNIKNQNPGLYDKTVGGHVSAGDNWDMTVIRECAEELGFPAAILSGRDFQKSIKITDLNIIGIFQKIDEVNSFQSVRLTNKGKFIISQIVSFYIGYYDGAIRFVDGESSGIEVFSLEELKKELKDNPDKFTEDIKFMIEKYEKYLKEIGKIK